MIVNQKPKVVGGSGPTRVRVVVVVEWVCKGLSQ